MADGYTIRFKQLGVIFNFIQPERQKKNFYGDAVIYTMGRPVIEDILDDKATLDTAVLEQLDQEFVNYFEPTFVFNQNQNDTDKEVNDVPVNEVHPPVDIPVPQTDPEYEIIIPKESEGATVVKVNTTHNDTPTDNAHITDSIGSVPSVSFGDQDVSPENEQQESVTPSDQSNEVVSDEQHGSNSNSSPVVTPLDTYVPEPEDPNYKAPAYDVIIGKNGSEAHVSLHHR